MALKLKGSRLEAEVDKCRSDCNWTRLGDLLTAIRGKNSGIDTALGDMYEAEFIIESFIDKQSEYIEPRLEHKSQFERAAKLLMSVLDSPAAQKATIYLETNLLLAKLFYYSADFERALCYIENSRLELGETPFVSLRDLRLVAEAYAIKGFSIEAQMKRVRGAEIKKLQTRALFCFEKSAELAISYVQEMEKSINSQRSAITQMNMGGNEKMGELLESTLERVPVLMLRHNLIERSWDQQGIEWYRRIMTSLGDKVVGEKLQQRLSRQLAEVLIRGMPDADYIESQSVSTKSQSLGFYTGSHKSYFLPSSRIEEILLLLLISEVLTTKDVVLSRSEELSSSRNDSIKTAKSVYNLLTLVLSSLRQYELLASIYEKSMKFVNEDKHIWYQFALTLMCHGRFVRASRILSQCLAFEQYSDNALAQHIFSSQIAIEYIGDYDAAINHAEQAIQCCNGNWLSGRCILLKALAISLKSEAVLRHKERSALQLESIALFKKAVELDSHDDLVLYYLARQYAIARDHTSAREWCERSLELNPELPSAIMLLALIFTAQKDYKAAMELIVDALEDFPTNFALMTLKLKIEVKFGRIDEALATSQHLLYVWRKNQLNYATDPSARIAPSNCGKDQREPATGSLLRSVSSRDASTVPPYSMISSFNFSNVAASDGPDNMSVHTGIASASDFGITYSATSEPSSLQSRTLQARFKFQANIWLELAELFLDLDRMDDVCPCVEEACTLFPSSHQALYLKGRMLSVRANRCDDSTVRTRLLIDAKASFLGALAILPSHVPSLRHLAMLYRLDGNIRLAEKMLRDVVQIDPLDDECWQTLGMVLAEDSRYEDALECYRTAMALSSSTPLIPFSSLPIVLRNLY